MREVHFKISNELFSRIEEYRLNNNYNKTQAYISLIEFGLNKTDEKIIFKQLYSDLEIENNTNPNKNISLQEFKRKQFKDMFND